MSDTTGNAQSAKKRILVLGGGFGGVITIFELLKHLSLNKYEITLIDKNDYHFYCPNAYEVATSEEDFSNIPELKATITFPFANFLPKGLKFIQGSVGSIDRQANTVMVNDKAVVFDYCVVAMGAQSAFYGIPGLAENALTLKSFTDALKYRNVVEQTVQLRSGQMTEAPVRIIVGGGGFTGVEIASETVNLLGIISEKYGYNLDKFEILVVDGNPTILGGLPEEIIDSVVRRMKHLQIPIEFRLGFAVKSVDEKSITLSNGEVVDYDVFVWTGGVQAVPAPFVQKDGATSMLDKRGRIQVDKMLRVAKTGGTYEGSNVFAIGDNALILDDSGKPVAQTAQQAVAQAEYLGFVIPALINGKKVGPFVAKAQIFILPVCGKWAVARFPKGFTMYGYIPWLMHNVATFGYLKRLMPVMKAASVTWNGMKVYTRNDM